MKVKHTPGPWFIDPTACCDIQSPGPREIACTSADVLLSGRKPKLSEQFANAILIAAAPELLEALEAVCEEMDSCLDNEDIDRSAFMPRVHAAIAKAKGE